VFFHEHPLFYFAGKYYHRPGPPRLLVLSAQQQAWELGWTVVPAVVMIGRHHLRSFRVEPKITARLPRARMEVELYAKQFNWTARYPGKDKQLGATDFRLINANNPLGIVTANTVHQARWPTWPPRPGRLEKKLPRKADVPAPSERLSRQDEAHRPPAPHARGHHEPAHVDGAGHRRANGANSKYLHGADDVVIKEFHLPVRGRGTADPQPGRDPQRLPAPPAGTDERRARHEHRIHMKPTITTDSMRTSDGQPEFRLSFCSATRSAASHYNMQMPLTMEPRCLHRWLDQKVAAV
jgi:heme/copper-type cytochrome/quinol oxidase subunit 2